jgi:DNA-binding NarL/FixJ family response regulator
VTGTAIRVALADDDVLLREGLASLLERSGFVVTRQCGDGSELVALVREQEPELAIVDIRMPPDHATEGLDAARVIRAEFPDIAILVLSAHVEIEHATDLLTSGKRSGYLLKSRVLDVDDFIETLKRIVRGSSVVDPVLVQALIEARHVDDPRFAPGGPEHLYLRQLQDGVARLRPQTPAYPAVSAAFAAIVHDLLDTVGELTEDRPRQASGQAADAYLAMLQAIEAAQREHVDVAAALKGEGEVGGAPGMAPDQLAETSRWATLEDAELGTFRQNAPGRLAADLEAVLFTPAGMAVQKVRGEILASPRTAAAHITAGTWLDASATRISGLRQLESGAAAVLATTASRDLQAARAGDQHLESRRRRNPDNGRASRGQRLAPGHAPYPFGTHGLDLADLGADRHSRPGPRAGQLLTAGHEGSGADGRGRGRGPVPLQVRHEVYGPLVREEQPGAVHRDHAGGAGDGLLQPVGPGHVEERVPGPPHHQRGHGELAEQRRDGGQVGGVEGGQQPLELAGALHRPDARFQIGAQDGPVDPVQVLISAAEGDLGSGLEVGEQRDGGRRQVPGPGQLDGRLEPLGRDVVAGVAVGEGKRGQAFRVAGGEDLGDGPAGVVRDEIDAGQPQRDAEVLKAGGQGGERQVLFGGHWALAMQREVDGDVAALAGMLRRQRADDIAPQVGVGGDAVHEQGGRPGSDVEVADLAGAGRNGVPMGLELW